MPRKCVISLLHTLWGDGETLLPHAVDGGMYVLCHVSM